MQHRHSFATERRCDACQLPMPPRLLDKAIGSHVQNGASAAEMGLAGAAGALPPQYVDFKEATRRQMLGIKAKMGELRKLHGQVGCDALACRLMRCVRHDVVLEAARPA
jgi:hypothetical protein